MNLKSAQLKYVHPELFFSAVEYSFDDKISRYGDHYRWNKVTTCVHNILGGQRWVDQFGEMTITNGSIVCKLTFPKASHYYQADKRHEVYGSILNPEGKIVHNLFGLWNEALYCGQSATARCIWRPGMFSLVFQLYFSSCHHGQVAKTLSVNQFGGLLSSNNQGMLSDGQIYFVRKLPFNERCVMRGMKEILLHKYRCWLVLTASL